MQANLKISLTKSQFPIPLYSPRTSYSNHLREINSLKTNMIINIDKYILGNLKAEFEKRGKEINLLEFVYFCKKYLKDWNVELYGREFKMDQCLLDVWKEIDVEGRGRISWEEFNSKIIQTSLNLKSLSNNAGIQAPSFKQLPSPILPAKYQNPIAKLIYLKNKNKMAFFREQSIQLQFFSTQNTPQQLPQTKPLILPQQQLKVQTMIKVKQKNESAVGEKVVRHPQKMVKKDLKVSSYKNTVIDSIYLDDEKYDMLMVSSSDKFVRGYNVSGLVPVIESQPENEDEQMVHQFPVEIYAMAWDSVNQVLYATGKHPKIYQWVIKTDSQRQMTDVKGHDKMISAMLMMPKLQLLATGGYDGRLILWDTVGQVVKCRYQQHARAISSIAFHQGLILLFTSSFDHKICIWNPYITSLIHKIDNTLNVISIEIIPNTNYLLSLDCGGTVKIREINRFTQVASFSILRSDASEDTQAVSKQDKTDRELSISMCSKKDGSVHYYFGTQKIVGYQYFEIEKSSIVGGSVTQMKYDSLRFRLFTPLKNHVVVWNLLTGRMDEIFYDMTEGDITTMEVAPQLSFFICGDVEGNVVQRKLSNGFFIKNLAKIKGAVNTMKFHQLERNQKQKSLKKTYLLFCTTQEGEVTVFKAHPKTEFTLYKQFSIRGDFGILHGNLVGIQYFGVKNILAIRLNTNELLFVDVQKRSLLIKIEFGDIIIGGMNVIDHKDSYYFITWNKSSQITCFHLPPHPKKFKTSSCLQLQTISKPQSSLYAPKSHLYFFSTQQSELYCIPFAKKYLQVDNYTPTLNVEWKIQLQKRVVSMMMIEEEKVLVVLMQGEQVMFLDASSGQLVCRMKQDIRAEGMGGKEAQPILHFREKTNEIYIPNEDKVIKLETDQLQQTKQRRILDPNFFTNHLVTKNIKNINKLSTPGWDLQLNFNQFVQKRIKEIQQIQMKLNNGVQKMFQKKGPTDVQKKIEKALELQKKWQKEKDMQNNMQLTRNPHSMSKLQRTSSNFNKNLPRANSISLLWKGKELARKSQHSFGNKSKKVVKEHDMTVTKSKFSDLEKVDLSKLRNDPLYRLGQALKSVNVRDKKAENFIEMAKKKQELKLPKINNQKAKQ